MKLQALDRTDVRILCALQQHGPLSKSQLAEAVNLSATPCRIRLDRLKKAGVVRGFHANIRLDAIAAITEVVVTVSLKSHRKADFERFESIVLAQNEITRCVATGGGIDYLITVVTPNLQTFQLLMDRLLTSDHNIERYLTYIVTRTVKSTQPDLSSLLEY